MKRIRFHSPFISIRWNFYRWTSQFVWLRFFCWFYLFLYYRCIQQYISMEKKPTRHRAKKRCAPRINYYELNFNYISIFVLLQMAWSVSRNWHNAVQRAAGPTKTGTAKCVLISILHRILINIVDFSVVGICSPNDLLVTEWKKNCNESEKRRTTTAWKKITTTHRLF